MTDDQQIVPCLWLDDQAEAAASFYTASFPDGRVEAVARYPSTGSNPAHRAPGSVLTVDFTIAGLRFTALNGGAEFKINPSVSFYVHLPDGKAVDALHALLVDGGVELMPLGEYPWSPRYSWVQDRFGVSWQLYARPDTMSAAITPCLMFTRELDGRAREAVEQYVRAFPSSRVVEAGQVEGDGATLFPFELAGQPMAAMDGGAGHAFGFNEAVSLQVMCEGQAEIDRYTEALSTGGGEVGPCGWVRDRFGVWWQVVPKGLARWLTSGEEAARDRVFNALMGMRKLDVAALEAAHRGG